jgi:beta-barrel assembly-enhancing protease
MSSYGQGFGGFGRRGGGGKARWVIAAVIALVGIVGYFAKEKVTNPETGETYRRAMNVDQQKALGLQAAKQMIPQMGGAVDPKTSADAALVAEVGRRLVENSNAAQSQFADNFHFFLVNDPRTINAFALPGGQVSITRGLYEQLENEAQLAGVLGHEIGHVIAEHSAQQMAKGQLGQMLATAVGVGSDDQRVAAGSQMANQMLQLKYGRDDERQSDSIGLKYMVQAGYDPQGMLGVMRILKEAAGGGRQPEFLSSHPHPEERLKTIQEFLDRNKDQLAKMDLTPGRPLKSGVPRDGPMPKSDRGRLPKEQW